MKEYYFYLDSTPTHSYLKSLYKYPQRVSPTPIWLRESAAAGTTSSTSCIDTGVFDDDRYFDVFVEDMRKAVRETSSSASRSRIAGPRRPSYTCCRHCGSATTGRPWIAASYRASKKPSLKPDRGSRRDECGCGGSPHCWVNSFLPAEGVVPLLFTENETNNERLFPGEPNASPYVKDGINDCIVQGKQGAVNAAKQGTKVAAHYRD